MYVCRVCVFFQLAQPLLPDSFSCGLKSCLAMTNLSLSLSLSLKTFCLSRHIPPIQFLLWTKLFSDFLYYSYKILRIC
uniref:Uncharacterized protein n=1 Tax=Octopus bimaculoides TaxID=37653 RepID=A0A0L8G6K1_OCTBM